MFLVVCNLQPQKIISKAHFPIPAVFLIIIILNKNNLFEFKHVDGPDESSMPNSVRMLSSEDSSMMPKQPTSICRLAVGGDMYPSH